MAGTASFTTIMAKTDTNHVRVIDIHQNKPEKSLLNLTLEGLKPQDGGPRHLPTLLLYDGTITLNSGVLY